jgi:hypothetical protein
MVTVNITKRTLEANFERLIGLFYEDFQDFEVELKRLSSKRGKFSFHLEERFDSFLEWEERGEKITLSLYEFFGGGGREKEEEIDFSILPDSPKVKMLIGGTGTGKTYSAISNSDSFVIAVPTRQLAYEIAYDYKEKIGAILTGEVDINKDGNNTVCVYENLNEGIIDKYDTLIVDECHFINDPQRGPELLKKVVYALANGKEVVFLTATDTISSELKELLGVEAIELKPFKKVEKIELDSEAQVCDLAQEGKTILVFTKYAPDEFEVELYA